MSQSPPHSVCPLGHQEVAAAAVPHVHVPVHPVTCLGSNKGLFSARVEVAELRRDFLKENYGRVTDQTRMPFTHRKVSPKLSGQNVNSELGNRSEKSWHVWHMASVLILLQM